MANSNFVVQNGLTVGPLTIDAATGRITNTSANPNNYFTGNLVVSTMGTNAQALLGSYGLTNTMFLATGSANSFTQASIINTSNSFSSSTDFIAYNANGDNNSGFIDMGITAPGFADPVYGITRGNEGYIFVSAANNQPGSGNLVIATDQTGTYNSIVFAAGGFGATTYQGAFVAGDGLNVLGNIVSTQGNLYQGPTARTLIANNSQFAGYSGLTNATGIFTGAVNDFVQFALRNNTSGSDASTDFIAYASNGDNNSGYMDMGITSSAFSTATYGTTGPNDGYIFMSAPSGTTGNGSAFISTDNTGQQNDIVFTTNGFAAGNERMRIIGQSRSGKPAGVEIYITTTSISPSTGALRVQGGIGCQGNVNVQGNVTVQGNIYFSGGGTQLSADNLSVTNPMIFVGNTNPGDSYSLGLVDIKKISGVNQYGGLVRDYSTGFYNLFANLRVLPTTTIDFTNVNILYTTLKVGESWVANSTVSTSTTSGALRVSGGAGIVGNVYVGGLINAAGNILNNANANYDIGSTVNYYNNLYGVNLTIANSIVPTGNAIASIGSVNKQFKNIYGVNFYGTSTTALYADLAEKYKADANYEPGTVVDFGGVCEITMSNIDASQYVAGVISSNPAYLMNNVDGENMLPVALQGRVPCKVTGPVEKGAMMVSNGDGTARMERNPKMGSVIGKALENKGDGTGVIEVVVGRL
jgi:hypothetical protein